MELKSLSSFLNQNQTSNSSGLNTNQLIHNHQRNQSFNNQNTNNFNQNYGRSISSDNYTYNEKFRDQDSMDFRNNNNIVSSYRPNN